jgi:hypothetical protein
VNRIGNDPLQRRLELTNWVVLLIFVAVSAPFMSAKFTFGVAAGGLICIVNYHWLKRSLRAVFAQLSGNPRGAVMVRYYIRFVLTAVVLFVLISRYLVDVIGLLIGLSVVVINIVATIIVMFAKKNRPEEAY